MTVIHTSVNEDVPLQMVVRPECSITVSADVTLGVLYAHRSIVVDAEDLQAQRKQTHTEMFLFSFTSVTVGNSHTRSGEVIYKTLFLRED